MAPSPLHGTMFLKQSMLRSGRRSIRMIAVLAVRASCRPIAVGPSASALLVAAVGL
jgi:hypothetical protein